MRQWLVAVAILIPNHSPAELAQTRSDPARCLALNIYHEARGEPLAGRVAVAFVTLNRVESPYYPDDVCAVVWEKRWRSDLQRYVAQFSWTLDGASDQPSDRRAWHDALELARRVLARHPENNVGDATLYHAHHVEPHWASHRERVRRVGQHIFYR